MGSCLATSIVVALNATLGGRAVCVLDGLVSEQQRAEILEFLHGERAASVPNSAVWDRSTIDTAGVAPTFGLRQELLLTLETDPPRAVRQIHARLCTLYPEYEIVHMPAFSEDGGGGTRTSFVANAAVQGDCFQWHVDADPQDLPSQSSAETARWRARHGRYTNGTLGKPLFVSLIVYPDEAWHQAWDAETLFLDPGTGAGLIVQPRPGRVVLMHQDVLHRVSPPSALACRPRYSLVWKLIFVPKARSDSNSQASAMASAATIDRCETICRPEWGEPVRFCGARRPAVAFEAS